MKVRIKKLNEKAVMPTKAHATDAGFDLYCTSKEIDWGRRQLVCHTGLAFEIPEGYVGLIFPRSSVSGKPLMMANSVGVVDSGYRGEVTAKFNITDTRYSAFSHYQEGDRIAQMIIILIRRLSSRRLTAFPTATEAPAAMVQQGGSHEV